MEGKVCFIVMGFGKKKDPDTNRTIDLDATYKKIIRPAVESAGCKCIRADEIVESGIIDRSMSRFYIMRILSSLIYQHLIPMQYMS
ncbi:hypothetical protein [Alistipes ihumii]|uniref:hypothetical protein n=1 Tax=Alistipes ihumii TaxID=1470347 RepID=UPI0039F5F103